jgi:hypothetical protein
MQKSPWQPPPWVNKRLVRVVLTWSFLILLSMAWNYHNENQQTEQLLVSVASGQKHLFGHHEP